MCWTQGKPDKLLYLRNIRMWYLTDTCSSLESIIPKRTFSFWGDGSSVTVDYGFGRANGLEKPGYIYDFLKRRSDNNRYNNHYDNWGSLRKMCCKQSLSSSLLSSLSLSSSSSSFVYHQNNDHTNAINEMLIANRTY